MQITQAQKQEFFENGVLKLPGIVSGELIQRARRAINANLGENGMHPDDLPRLRAQTYCPALSGEPVITDLYNASPIRGLVEQMVGEGQLKPVKHGQIALRFPRPVDPPELVFRPHLDGMYSPTNGVKEGTIGNFTALIGVFLSDVPEPNSGNFTTWNGTHRLYEEYFREHGPESLLQGMPPVELPEAEQFTGVAGDAALVHYQIAHGIAPNISPNVRYAVFFRLFHVDHDQNHWSCMTNIWQEWSGMQGIKM
ncbi:MAG: hypothetical protein H8F28_13185 [Fibrella sp.]|nr:hypothetical protein [Armatimonadota bacterium]